MKNLILSLMFFIFACSTSAQNINQQLNSAQKSIESRFKLPAFSGKSVKHVSVRNMQLKSSSDTYKLDSIVGLTFIPETQFWKNDYKHEYFYDSELKSTSWVSNEWSDSGLAWDVWNKTELEYNNRDFVSLVLFYEKKSEMAPLVNLSKMYLFHNSEGVLDSAITYSSLAEGSPMLVDMKQYYYYNESKQLQKTDVWVYDRDSEELLHSHVLINSYTNSGLIKSTTTSFIVDDEEVPFSKVEYSYNSNEKLVSEVNSMVDFLTSEMVNVSRTTYQYNPAGQVSVEIYSTLNGTVWIDDNKTEYTYNGAGDVSVETYSEWNGTAWVEKEKEEYQYNSMNFSDVVFPNFYVLFGMSVEPDLRYNKLVVADNSYEKLDGQWKHTDKSTYFYSSETSSGINETGNSLFSAYPNPVKESVKFSWKGNYENLKLVLYQVTGTKVMEQTITSGQPVSISQFENGVYIYKLLNSKQTLKTGKLIKN